MESRINKMNLSFEMEKEFEYSKWHKEIPYLKFKEDWLVRAVPPSVGAVIRYNIMKGNAFVSIYLDCYDNLGSVGVPYWEIYPSVNGDTERYIMHKTDDLVKGIEESLNNQFISYETN